MSTRTCPFCEDAVIDVISLKNGQWAAEPLETYEIDPKGWLCADWDKSRLKIYLHNRDIFR